MDAWIEIWLSEPRFRRYERRAGAKALALYEWNAVLSVAFFEDLGHFEVALRNAYHRAFSEHSRWGDRWVFFGHEVFPPHMRDGWDQNAKTREILVRAIEEVGGDASNPDSVTPGEVVAELTLGFWFYLTRGSNQDLWVRTLHKSFVGGTTRKGIHNEVKVLYDLRNRIAHHEHIYDHRVYAAQQTLFRACDRISNRITDFIGQRSLLPQLEAKAPVDDLRLR